MDMFEKEWHILCWTAKWLDNKTPITSALPDFKECYKKDPESDKQILIKLWKLLDEADIVVTHNGVNFDIKKINSRFICNGMLPTSPFKQVDTCLTARKKFGFTSNKLGDLGKILGLGAKKDTGGFKLWKQCMAGDLKAWKKMVSYCKGDVYLLEKVYKKMLPFIDTHPNLGIYMNSDKPRCTNCGHTKLTKRGLSRNTSFTYQRLVCNKCGSWCKMKLDKNKIQVTK
jgi:predicted RNA-binding Zn-ribbon protein involved in translation (DUF1610 family)